MKISSILIEVKDIAGRYDLQLVEVDTTDHTISLKLLIDYDLFIKVYGNTQKNKVNLALIFKNRRLYGYDSEGGEYHHHPFDAPDEHIFVHERKSIQDSVQESMRFLEEKEIL